MLKLYLVKVKIISGMKILALGSLQLLIPEWFICSDGKYKVNSTNNQNDQRKMSLSQQFVSFELCPSI